jgi:hypothetical protein
MKEFAEFKNGKWRGMEQELHIGFVTWNDDNYRNPLRVMVEPAHKPRLSVSRKNSEKVYHKTYGGPMTIEVKDFMYAGNDEVIIEIANDGIGVLNYIIEADGEYNWLGISSMNGSVESQEEIILKCDRSKLTEKTQKARLLIKGEGAVVAVAVKARAVNTENLPPMTFLESRGVITINANHFCDNKSAGEAKFTELVNYGRSGAGMKVFPTALDFAESDEKPALTYRFLIEEEGNYIAEIWTTPTNSVQNKRPLRFMLNNQAYTTIDADFNAGSPGDLNWCAGVLDNIRITEVKLKLDKGVQEITIGALEAGLILERILIYKKGDEPKESYLGPKESFYTK